MRPNCLSGSEAPRGTQQPRSAARKVRLLHLRPSGAVNRHLRGQIEMQSDHMAHRMASLLHPSSRQKLWGLVLNFKQDRRGAVWFWPLSGSSRFQA